MHLQFLLACSARALSVSQHLAPLSPYAPATLFLCCYPFPLLLLLLAHLAMHFAICILFAFLLAYFDYVLPTAAAHTRTHIHSHSHTQTEAPPRRKPALFAMHCIILFSCKKVEDLSPTFVAYRSEPNEQREQESASEVAEISERE